jgi:hypothetical protein
LDRARDALMDCELEISQHTQVHTDPVNSYWRSTVLVLAHQ